MATDPSVELYIEEHLPLSAHVSRLMALQRMLDQHAKDARRKAIAALQESRQKRDKPEKDEPGALRPNRERRWSQIGRLLERSTALQQERLLLNEDCRSIVNCALENSYRIRTPLLASALLSLPDGVQPAPRSPQVPSPKAFLKKTLNNRKNARVRVMGRVGGSGRGARRSTRGRSSATGRAPKAMPREEVKPPPVVQPVPVEDVEMVESVCGICNQGEKGGDAMVACDVCDCWYHYACVGIDEVLLANQTEWFCGACR